MKVQATTPEQKPQELDAGKSAGTSEPGDEVKQGARNDPHMGDSVEVEASSVDTTGSDEANAVEMDVAGASGIVVKRIREQADSQDGQIGDPTSEEPPEKSAVTRRSTFRPKPTIPLDSKRAATKLK
ncbi:hypothetical protein HPB49_010761 [Dermacentor silvarum]|uniref:Uncharacterized protein n=1 Tax=Dermacentor silvarum TaxID=543639 RepID=A0ACB8CWW7_DERSI|nr:hypothetical protein HPB49_010761 [Dermacentor silvarum]